MSWAYLVSGSNVVTIKRSIQLEMLVLLALTSALTVLIQTVACRFSLLYTGLVLGVAPELCFFEGLLSDACKWY